MNYTHTNMSISQLLKISRPRFWIYLIGPYLVGLAAAGVAPSPVLLLLGFYLTFPANLLIYGVNDLFDRETDKLNAKKDSYEARLQDDTVHLLIKTILLTNLPILIILALWLPHVALPWLVLFVVTGVGYSAPPLRAKAKPFLDAAFNILYVAPGFAAYSAVANSMPTWPIVFASLAWCMAMHAYSAVPDIDADRASRTPTIATTLGAVKTLLFCGVCYAAAGLLSYHYLGWFAVAGAVAYLFMIGLSLRRVHEPSALFKLYTLFPYVNTALGAGLFFVVLAV